MDRRKLVTIIVVLFTVVLAGVAVFTAVTLYNNRQQSVAPTAPTSIPRAAETASPTPNVTACAELTINLSTPTATATATATGTGTPAPTATPTATPGRTAAPTATPTAAPQLPVAGVAGPTILGVVIGLFAIVGALALAF